MHPIAFALLVSHSSAGFGADAATVHAQLAAQVEAAFDSGRGGFVSKSGSPFESAVELAFQQAGSRNGGSWLREAETTMMWTHGLMDTLTGGYVTSMTNLDIADGLDRRADLNGRRLELLIAGWQLTKNDAYRRDAAKVVDWAERVLLDGRGGFVTAQIGDRNLEPASNGQILHAWLLWAAATHDRRRRDFALRSLDRVWEECWVEGLGLVRKNSMGDVDKEPQLLDQVEMGRAYVLAARLCGRTQDGDRARILGELMLARFAEPSGAFRTQSMPSKNGSIRKARSLSGENARAARFLCELSALTESARYRDAASRAAGPFTKDMSKAGAEAADWAMAFRASYDADLPGRGDFAAEIDKDQEPPRKRSVRFRLGH